MESPFLCSPASFSVPCLLPRLVVNILRAQLSISKHLIHIFLQSESQCIVTDRKSPSHPTWMLSQRSRPPGAEPSSKSGGTRHHSPSVCHSFVCRTVTSRSAGQGELTSSHCSLGNIFWVRVVPGLSPPEQGARGLGTLAVTHYLIVWPTWEHRAALVAACASCRTIVRATNGVHRLRSWSSPPYAYTHAINNPLRAS